MATVRKTILVPGKHASPDGNIQITPERSRAYVEKFQRLKSKGVNFPVCWGHTRHATPDNQTFLASRFNAGYLQDLFCGPNGEIDAVLDCPALTLEGDCLVGYAQTENGAMVKTAIKEVSPGIFNKYRDGQGEVHEDIIGHLALTPLPVQLNQTGFTALSTESQDDDFKVIYLATDPERKPEDADDLGQAVQKASGKDDGATDGPAPDGNNPFTPPPPAVDPNAERCQQLVMDLGAVGCPLPPDTTPDNFLERFAIAFAVLKAQLEKAQQAQPAANANPQQPAPITEQQPPGSGMTMLATRIDSDTVLRSVLAGELHDKSNARFARIESMRKRGLKGHIADSLKQSAELVKPDVVRLSTFIDEQGQRRKLQVDVMLDYLDEQLPREEFAATYLSTIAPTDVAEAASPIEPPTPSAQIGNIAMTPELKAEIEADMARIGR